MSVRNRPMPERPTGSEIDTRSTEEIAASVRRKLLFILIALAAVPTSIGLSWAASKARESVMISLLPAGVTMDSPVKGAQGPSVGAALARVGAYPTESIIVDYEGHPILFRRDGQSIPYKDGTAPDPDSDDPKSKPRIVEVDGEGESETEVSRTERPD